ncbi:uncharacterized protein LOC124266200 [Haliotis rubra]|uniref:uncharacterized protein LOC124266200 n=1 Tax=Haliotis rubra TaxID=36100 RepID=UPI001EE628C0|nr:uncharacterized protein LOC124266200 [Haliotis rubra]
MRWLFLLVCVLTLTVLAYGNTSTDTGCPEGKKEGDIWTTHGETECETCRCEEALTVCKDCLEMLDPYSLIPGCYLKETQVKDGEYPSCCKMDRNICPDDKDFKQSELEAFQSQQMVDIAQQEEEEVDGDLLGTMQRDL